MESEDIIEVTDKRGGNTDGGKQNGGSERVATPGSEAEGESAQTPPLPPMDVYGLLKTTISLLSNGAWAWMGLSPSPFTGEMDRDLDQAKIAIDTVAYLVGQVEPHLADAERREMQNVVSMLRVNYVQQLSK